MATTDTPGLNPAKNSAFLDKLERDKPGAKAAASRSAREGAQEGGLKAVDMTEDARPRQRQPVRREPAPMYQRTFARPGKLLAPPVPAARHVLLAMTGGMVVFFIAGGRFGEILQRVRGQQATEGDEKIVMENAFQTMLGWGALLGILIFMADTGVMAPLAIGFSWLIFFMVMMVYGERAAKNMLTLFGKKPTQTEDVELHLPDTRVRNQLRLVEGGIA